MITPAKQALKKRAIPVLASYFIIFLCTMLTVDRIHPTGGLLYALAALPSIPFVLIFFLVGQYLMSERDGFTRDLMMRCILWGTAAALTVSMFAGFLQIFGWHGHLPPFAEFWAFAISMMAAKFSYRVSNPLPADE